MLAACLLAAVVVPSLVLLVAVWRHAGRVRAETETAWLDRNW